MAQSYIDKYVFALMLDSSNFEKGANLATKAANGVKNTLLKTYSIIGGIDLFKSMLTDYTEATRSIDNLNLITGENITTLQAWKKSIQDVGGNVGAFEGTLKGLSNSLADLRQFGKYDDRLGILGWRGISLYQDGKMKNATTLLSEIAKKIKDMNESDAFSWASALGIDESTYRLFRLHGDSIDDLIKKNKQWAVLNKEDVKTTRQYDKIISDFKSSWQSLSRILVSSILPVIQNDLFPELENLVKYLTTNKDEVKDFFNNIGEGVREILPGVIEVAKAIGTVATWVVKGAQGAGEAAGTAVGSLETISNKVINDAMMRAKTPGFGLMKPLQLPSMNTVINNNFNGEINVGRTSDVSSAVENVYKGGTNAGSSLTTQAGVNVSSL